MKARGRQLESDLEQMHARYLERGITITRLQPPSIAGAGGRLRATDEGPCDFEGSGHAVEAKESSRLDWDSSLLKPHQRSFLEFYPGRAWVYLRLTSSTLRVEAQEGERRGERWVKRPVPAQRHLHDWLIPWPALRTRYATERPGHIGPEWLMRNAYVVAGCDWLEAAGRMA